MSNKGKLYITTPQGEPEFVKECTQEEYVELAIYTPGQYTFVSYPGKQITIQDLNDFAERSMQLRNNGIEKQKPKKAKKSLIRTAKFWTIVSGIIGVITFLIFIVDMLLKYHLV